MRHQRYFKLACCPRCRDILKISFSMYGKTFHCPQCGKSLKLVSKQKRNKIDIESQSELAEIVQIKSVPENAQKIVEILLRPIKKIIDGMKYVLRLRSNKNS